MSDSAAVPTPIRVGGAFVALSVVLFIFTLVEVLTGDWLNPFPVTPRFLMICAAALIIGGYASLGAGQRASLTRILALAAALILVVIGRFIPNVTLFVMAQWWLPAYALLALGCGLVLRRSVAR